MDQLRVVAISKALSFVRKDLCQSDSMSFTAQWTILLLSSDVLQGINDKICSTDYTTYKAEIKNADAQESYKDGVIVLVTGLLTRKEDNRRRKFIQSFFLAPQDKGYFVLNHVFRYAVVAQG
ncbi:Ras GTPase-activating protein-binding protein 1-like protein isoform X3 [Tanacetum coccineum]